jgi:transcriptional regulator with XRE-family HTH domain
MDLGHKLKTLRVKKKLEPINIAEMLDISVNTYRKYERNESSPDLNMLEKIASIHEISIIDLLKDENYTFNNYENQNCSINNLVINNLSEKLIEQFEKRINEKDQLINEMKETILELRNKK